MPNRQATIRRTGIFFLPVEKGVLYTFHSQTAVFGVFQCSWKFLPVTIYFLMQEIFTRFFQKSAKNNRENFQHRFNTFQQIKMDELCISSDFSKRCTKTASDVTKITKCYNFPKIPKRSKPRKCVFYRLCYDVTDVTGKITLIYIEKFFCVFLKSRDISKNDAEISLARIYTVFFRNIVTFILYLFIINIKIPIIRALRLQLPVTKCSNLLLFYFFYQFIRNYKYLLNQRN